MVRIVHTSPYVSPHLRWSELACHDAIRTPVPLDVRDRAVDMAAEFEAIREACSRMAGHETPLTVLSAYRTPAYNATVPGSAPNSQHVQMRAIDLACPDGLTYGQFKDAIRSAARRPGSLIRFIQWYPARSFAHVDIRPTQTLREKTEP